MSTTDHISRNPAGSRRRSTFVQFLRRGIRRWQRRRAITELSRLDDMQLEDIGLSRNDIPHAVDRIFSRGAADAKAVPQAGSGMDQPVIPPATYPRAA